MFCFHPYLGKIPSSTNIFQMGLNHQLVNVAFSQVLLGFFDISTRIPNKDIELILEFVTISILDGQNIPMDVTY